MTHPSPRIRRSKYSIDGILPGWTSQGDVEHTYMGEHSLGAPKRCCHPLILQRDGILGRSLGSTPLRRRGKRSSPPYSGN
jgi:hypothetical protein